MQLESLAPEIHELFETRKLFHQNFKTMPSGGWCKIFLTEKFRRQFDLTTEKMEKNEKMV